MSSLTTWFCGEEASLATACVITCAPPCAVLLLGCISELVATLYYLQYSRATASRTRQLHSAQSVAILLLGLGISAGAFFVDAEAASEQASDLWSHPAPYRIVSAASWLVACSILSAGRSQMAVAWASLILAARGTILVVSISTHPH